MNLDNDQLFVSPIPINPEQQIGEASYMPIIRLATPLFNADSEKKGILTLDLDFTKVLELLPGNIFIQTAEGNIVSLRRDGTLSLRKSPYIFQDNSGWLYLSEVETIHYSTVEILPGKRFIVALYHSHPLLKAAMLTHEEYEEMKEHVRIGKQVLLDAIDKFK